MNLLEHYINRVQDETIRKIGDNEYIIATMEVDCYGQKSINKHMFALDEWEQAKKDGYYLA